MVFSVTLHCIPGFGAPRAPRELAGVTVFHAGLAGVHNYRIPAIVQTSTALVALAEARDGDDSSASRISSRVSHDDGVTWSPNVTFAAGSLDTPAARAACAASRTCAAAPPPTRTHAKPSPTRTQNLHSRSFKAAVHAHAT